VSHVSLWVSGLGSFPEPGLFCVARIADRPTARSLARGRKGRSLLLGAPPLSARRPGPSRLLRGACGDRHRLRRCPGGLSTRPSCSGTWPSKIVLSPSPGWLRPSRWASEDLKVRHTGDARRGPEDPRRARFLAAIRGRISALAESRPSRSKARRRPTFQGVGLGMWPLAEADFVYSSGRDRWTLRLTPSTAPFLQRSEGRPARS